MPRQPLFSLMPVTSVELLNNRLLLLVPFGVFCPRWYPKGDQIVRFSGPLGWTRNLPNMALYVFTLFAFFFKFFGPWAPFVGSFFVPVAPFWGPWAVPWCLLVAVLAVWSPRPLSLRPLRVLCSIATIRDPFTCCFASTLSILLLSDSSPLAFPEFVCHFPRADLLFFLSLPNICIMES